MRTASILVSLVISTAALGAIEPVPQEVTPRRIDGAKARSVVFILSDDHRYDAMSFMGHQFAKTPYMDSMASGAAENAPNRWLDPPPPSHCA